MLPFVDSQLLQISFKHNKKNYHIMTPGTVDASELELIINITVRECSVSNFVSEKGLKTAEGKSKTKLKRESWIPPYKPSAPP